MALTTRDSEMSDDGDNISSSELDPYKDFLLHYLNNYGHFEPGSSEQQRKRILKVAKHFKLDNGVLFLVANIPKYAQTNILHYHSKLQVYSIE